MQTVDPDAAVIFVINHRSNMDYVLVTYMASTSSALSYAVGEWARVWLLQNLIRSMGAYFVRRDSREPLYRKVLSRYVHLAVAGGLTQAMFPEGGLTRDGKLRPPKLGLLSYMVSAFDPKGPRDAVFVPVGINYDRVIEDRVQVAALMTPEGEKPRFKFSPKVLFGYLAHNVALRFRGKLYRYGYACVSFGKPVSLRQYVTERGIDFRMLDETRRFAEIETPRRDADAEGRARWCPRFRFRWSRPSMLAAGKPLSALELKGEVADLIRRLIASGAHIHIPRADQDYAVEVGLRMLLLRHFVEEENGLYRANPKRRNPAALLCQLDRASCMCRCHARDAGRRRVRRNQRTRKRMLSDADRQKAADILMNAEKTRKQATQLSVTFPGITFEDAYAISTECAKRKMAAGAKLIGHKVGLTSKAMQQSSQIDEPDYGYLFDNMMVADGAKVPHENYCAPRVEVELAFVLGKELKGPGVGLTDVLRATEYVVPAIEIVDARMINPRKIFDTISDNGAAAGIVVGGRPVGPMDVDLRWVGGIMMRNSEIEETGVAAGVLGHPAMGVAWLANKLGQHGVALEPGHLVLAGSFTRVIWAQKGDTVRADFGALGSISLQFV